MPVVELETLRRAVVPYGIAVFLASIAVFDIRAVCWALLGGMTCDMGPE